MRNYKGVCVDYLFCIEWAMQPRNEMGFVERKDVGDSKDEKAPKELDTFVSCSPFFGQPSRLSHSKGTSRFICHRSLDAPLVVVALEVADAVVAGVHIVGSAVPKVPVRPLILVDLLKARLLGHLY